MNAENQITTASAGTINTSQSGGSGSAISLTGTNGIVLDHAYTFNSGGGNITLNNATTPNAALTVNTGSGTLTFGSTVDGANNLTATAGTFSFVSALGGTTQLSTVSLTLTNGLTLPSITASSILARTTGASSDITIPSVKLLTVSGSNTAITLAAGRNFINNAGSGALSTPSGRWLVYSTNPAADTAGGLVNDFRRFSCTYGGSCLSFPGTGTGLLYSYTPTLTATPSALSITYGDAPALTGYANTLSDYLGSDSSSDSVTGSIDRHGGRRAQAVPRTGSASLFRGRWNVSAQWSAASYSGS
jgi:hypothetical protein